MALYSEQVGNKNPKKKAPTSMTFASLENYPVLTEKTTNMKWAVYYDIAESFGDITATHCECFVRRHFPNNTSWWTLCRPRSHSSASHAGQSPPHISCGNTPSVWMQASDGGIGSDDKRNKWQGRKWKQAQSHYLCFRAVWGTGVINASHINTRVSGCQAPA